MSESQKPLLAQPISFHHSKKTARNRFLKAAMTEKLASYDQQNPLGRGKPNDHLTGIYQRWGEGEIGVIITGNIQVHREHLEAPGNVIIDPEIPEDYTPYLAEIATAAKAKGSLIIGQVSHPGRQNSVTVNPKALSPSNVQLELDWGKFGEPEPLTIDGIKDIVKRFAFAARVLYNAGFDGIQIHAAHGYLVNQFLSPVTNLRTDQYGGSLENRSRILFEIIEAINAALPSNASFIVGLKLNTGDLSEKGFNLEDAKKLAHRLDEEGGVDLIELSGGTYSDWPFDGTEAEGLFIDSAKEIRPQLKTTRLAVTGGFLSRDVMSKVLDNNIADFVGFGRPFAAEPDLALKFISGKSTKAKENKLPPSFFIRNVAATHQFRQFGNGEEPTDFSVQKNADEFLASLNAPKKA
ncbi:hypothetical protein FRC03_006881 [Tulasnella sp. 419]|nr:hypothetical protein FRC03_006881 [Tulasnella sp. 419]